MTALAKIDLASDSPKTLGRRPRVAVCDLLRWSLEQTAGLVGVSENTIVDMEADGEFPMRVPVPGTKKRQFIASEVRAWADGRDWRALVRARAERQDQP